MTAPFPCVLDRGRVLDEKDTDLSREERDRSPLFRRWHGPNLPTPTCPACLPTCCPHAVTEANLDNLPRSPESSSQPPFVLGSSNTCTVRFNEGPVLKRNMDPLPLSLSLSLCFSKSIPSGLLFFSIFLHRGGRLVYPSFRKRKGEKSVINIVVAIGKNWL